MRTRPHLITTLALVLAACGAAGPSVEVPRAPNPAWARFVVGDDIRAGCRPGAEDRFRLIQNAEHIHRLRSFEVVGDRGGAWVETRLIRAGELDVPGPRDVRRATRAADSVVRLSPGQFALLVNRIARTSGFKAPPPGARLPAGGYYWLVSGCWQGRYFLTAYDYPSDRFVETGAVGPAPQEWADAGVEL
ncbi:MAG TPA: hypothetical protein VEY95_09800 [Azospirillaceae bacterium]|nr:hypothetical protein [Azospirillaceae bacterium]